jgi:hypothetical protein
VIYRRIPVRPKLTAMIPVRAGSSLSNCFKVKHMQAAGQPKLGSSAEGQCLKQPLVPLKCMCRQAFALEGRVGSRNAEVDYCLSRSRVVGGVYSPGDVFH